MSEVTVPEALSGEEIKEAIHAELDRKLEQDCHLNAYLAYLSFEVEITIKAKLFDNGRVIELEKELRVAGGSMEAREKLSAQEWSSSYVLMPEKPPNVVRQEAGLPIPTLTETASGRKEIRPVKYARRTEHEGPEHEKKEHEHDPKKPGQGQPGQQPGQPGQQPQQEPKR